jgi:enoyl-CoA hydratase/carnithine racemase
MSVVVLERPSEGVALLRINRPEARNALNREVRQLLADHCRALGEDAETRAIVVTGNEKAFAAGADIKDMAEATPVEMMARGTHRYWQTIAQCPKPMIAAVNGFALGGGCELAMHCDIIIAGRGARFGQPEIKIGILPGGGGTQRLTRAVGKFQAMKICLLGEPFGGEEAFAMGLASEVVDDDKVLPRALELAAKLAALPPIAIMQIKELVLAGHDASLDAALLLERKAFQMLFATEDQKEGMRAFIEKRAPGYKGK